MSASHDAKRNQATISSLQHKIAQQPDSPSATPSAFSDRSLSPSPNGVRLDGEGGDAVREREAELLAQLHSAQQELAILRAQLSARKDDAQDEMDRDNGELEKMSAQVSQKQAEMDAIREQLSGKLEALRRQLAQTAENEARLEHELDEMKALRTQGGNERDLAELEELQQQLQHVQQVNAELRREVDEGHHKQAEIDVLHAQLQLAQDNLAKATLDKHAGADVEIDALRMSVENLREQLQQSQDKVVKEALFNSDLVKELEMERELLEKEVHMNTALTSELALERSKTKNQVEVDDLRAQLRESESRMFSVRAQLKQALDDLECEKHVNVELVEELDREKVRSNEANQNEMDSFRLKLRESESHCGTLREQLREALDDLEHEKNANSELVQEITNQSTSSSDKANQVEIESLHARVREVEQSMREQAEVAQHQVAHARGQLAEHQRKFGHTQAELDSLRTRYLNSQDELEKMMIANIDLEDQLRAKPRQTEGEDEESLLAQLQHAHEDLEKAIDANNELESQLQETLDELERTRANNKNHDSEDPKLAHAVRELEKQVGEDEAEIRRKDNELEDMRAQLRENESHVNTLLTQCQHAREQLDKVSNANSELEKLCNHKQVELNTQRAQMLANERHMDRLRVELLQVQDAVEKEKHARMELEVELEERMNASTTETDGEEEVLRTQVQQQKGDLDKLQIELREAQMEKEMDEQERMRLASMIEALQQENESLAVQLHRREGEQGSPRPNGKLESGASPRKATPRPKFSEEERDDDPEELEEGEIVEDEDEEEEEEEEEEIEDDEDDEDEKEELVEVLQEEIKQEQKRTTNLVQAIYTLQIELQQERTKQGEMDRTLEDLQRGNSRLTQEVYDLRNAWTDNASDSKGEEKEEVGQRGHEEGNGQWDGLEKELSNAVGLRAVALRTIMQGILSPPSSFYIH